MDILKSNFVGLCSVGNFEKKRAILSLGGKKKKGFSIMELAIYILVAAILLGAIAFAGSQMVNSAKVSNAKQELENLRSACMQYTIWNVNNDYPADLETLLSDTAIPADQAIDNVPHGPFITTNNRWTTAGIKDPWGNDYVYVVGESISSTQDGKGTITVELDKNL